MGRAGHPMALGFRRLACLTVVHRERAEHATTGLRYDRAGPTSAQTKWNRQLSIVRPVGVGADVGDDDRLTQVRGGPTRAFAGANHSAVYPLHERLRQVGRRAVADSLSIRIEQQNRTQQAIALTFDEQDDLE